MNINIGDISDGAVVNLLNAHLKAMHKYSPAESIHAITPTKLKQPSLTFWTARIDRQLAGCGALKELSITTGEVKSMKTDNAYLRMGVASKLLESIIKEALMRGYHTLSLETGTHPAFSPAIAMYKRYGFVECEPFADYKADPHSQFFSKRLFNKATESDTKKTTE